MTYIIAIISQSLVSIFHFALNVVMLIVLDVREYGVFALSLILAWLAVGANNALAATPLNVHLPSLDEHAAKSSCESVLTATSGALSLSILLVVFCVGLLYLEPGLTLVGVSTLCATWSLRQYARMIGYAKQRPRVALVSDVAYVTIGTFVLLVVYTNHENFEYNLGGVLIGVSFASIVGFVVAFRAAKVPLSNSVRWDRLLCYGPYWVESKWSLLGVATTNVMSYGHGYLVSIFLGVTSFSPLAAAAIFVRPMGMVFTSWQSVFRPSIANAISKMQLKDVRRVYILWTFILGVITLLFALFVFIYWGYLSDVIFNEKYSDYPMGQIVGMWFVVVFLQAIRTPAGGIAQAFRVFRPLAVVTVIGALVALLGMSAAIYREVPEETLLSLILSEIVVTILLLKLSSNNIRDAK